MKQALADALQQRGYTSLTEVQQAVTDPALITEDLLVSAQTGSGKTVGFGLAIAPTLLGDVDEFTRASAPLALVIAPTRELALQVKRELAWLYAKAGAVLASCVGGMDMRDERRLLERGAHIVVATPGRLRDHIMRGSIDLGQLRAVVLDEADEMLDLGFREDLEFILGEAPATRRTLMFSATVPRAIANLAKSYQKDAKRITAVGESTAHADIEYRAMNVSARDSENALINVLRYFEAPNALVFCNTRAMVNRLTTRFSNRGFSVVALSGELSQNERTHALQAMRDGRARVCVATDVAARGIDLPNLELVIHAELPSNAETLLHRSGRTGRAGRKGISALIVPPKSRRKGESLLRAAKVAAEWGEAPSAAQVREKDEERMMADPVWSDAVSEKLQTAAEKLLSLHAPEKIAAAYLQLFQAKQTAPEELSPSGGDGAPKPRAAFGPSVWFSIEGGQEARAEPRRLLPMLCKIGKITKDDIGAIRVHHTASYVEIRKPAVASFLSGLGASMRVEGGLVTELATPPAAASQPRPKFEPKKSHRKSHDSKPIDWNDEPAPRHKKPKPADRPKPRKSDDKLEGGKPHKARTGPSVPTPIGKPNSKKNKARRALGADGDGAKSGKFAGKPSGKPGGKSGGKFSGKPTGKPKRNRNAD